MRVFQRVDVAGEVTITPRIECGPVTVTCRHGEIVCSDDLTDEWRNLSTGDSQCRVLFLQELCVEVPVRIKVHGECDLTGLRRRTLMITNRGLTPLQVLGARITGEHAGDYRIAGVCAAAAAALRPAVQSVWVDLPVAFAAANQKGGQESPRPGPTDYYLLVRQHLQVALPINLAHRRT